MDPGGRSHRGRCRANPGPSQLLAIGLPSAPSAREGGDDPRVPGYGARDALPQQEGEHAR